MERPVELMALQSRSFWRAAAYAAILSAAGNGVLYLLCYVTGIIPWNMLSPGRGVSITPRLVLLVSLGGALAGSLIYWIIRGTSSRPVRTFRLVAGIVLILSFVAPFMIATFTTSLMIALDLMHVMVYAATVWVLTVWAREPRSEPAPDLSPVIGILHGKR